MPIIGLTNTNDLHAKKIIIKKNNLNNGTTLLLNQLKMPESTKNKKYTLLNKDPINVELDNNKILLSCYGDGDNDGLFFITNKDLTHNIKFIHKNNNLSEPRIIFHKYRDYIDNSLNNTENYLFNINDASNIDRANIKIQDKTFNLIPGNNNNPVINYYYNFYQNYKNSDYYKINFLDFIDLSNLSNQNSLNYGDISYNIKNVDLSNNFTDQPVNYIENTFKNLQYYSDNNINSINSYLDISNEIGISNDNILMYNQLNNLTKINISYYTKPDIDNSLNDSSYSNLSINFFVQKTHDYFSKKSHKLFLSNNDIYLSGFALDPSYNYDISFINGKHVIPQTIKDKYDTSYVFLSLGKGICGLTQKDLINRIKIDYNNGKVGIKKITFKKNSKLLKPELSNNYLLDNSYNYDYTNVLAYKINDNLSTKKIDLNLKNFIYGLKNYNTISFQRNFNNFELKNNNINDTYFDTCYNDLNLKFSISNIDFNIDSFKMNGTPSMSSNNILNYDFRFNYDQSFNVSNNLNLIYSSQHGDLVLNFNRINVVSRFVTSSASDFTNVDCIFVYHDPNTTEDLSFQYPNNNIKIIKNPEIDTLSKAIELLPGARTATSNSVFIPAKNGSNISRKMIQGLIGFGKEAIPKLLSIEPYDPNFINGRGFINQFQIGDDCLGDEERVNIKLNSQKHSSVKEKQNFNSIKERQLNFANIARSRARQRGINSTNADTLNNCPDNNISADNYNTPFKFYRKGKGMYLKPGK